MRLLPILLPHSWTETERDENLATDEKGEETIR